jgi:predicted PP-loop superfamily ATPase
MPPAREKLTLLERFRLNKEKQLRRLDELDAEDKAGLASQDQEYLRLRREYEDLEREFDRRNFKRLQEQSVAIYDGGTKTVTSVAALSGGIPRPRPKKKPKPKRKFRL